MVVPLTSDSVATLGTAVGGSLRRPDSDLQTGCNDLIACSPSALQNPLAVRGSEALSTEKLVMAKAFLARSQCCCPSTSLCAR